MILNVIDDSDPRLREKSVELLAVDMEKIEALEQDMFDTLAQYPTGVALAAPQVGVNVRMFIIRKNLAKQRNIHHTIINPTWKPLSVKEPMGEGCLSFEGVQVTKARHRAVVITYTTTNGKTVTKTVTDKLIAQIIQHETEHLDGIVLTDK
jgi:peptide deformylase